MKMQVTWQKSGYLKTIYISNQFTLFCKHVRQTRRQLKTSYFQSIWPNWSLEAIFNTCDI